MKAVNQVDRVWKLMDSIPFCMLVTRDDGLIRARPMGAHSRREENAVYFLTDGRRHKDEEIEAAPAVCLALRIPTSINMSL